MFYLAGGCHCGGMKSHGWRFLWQKIALISWIARILTIRKCCCCCLATTLVMGGYSSLLKGGGEGKMRNFDVCTAQYFD